MAKNMNTVDTPFSNNQNLRRSKQRYSGDASASPLLLFSNFRIILLIRNLIGKGLIAKL